jgi:hypothetical protein
MRREEYSFTLSSSDVRVQYLDHRIVLLSISFQVVMVIFRNNFVHKEIIPSN